ncbi:MAG: hypothetical protein KDA52_10955, partial [Planctomycetaceae bacterium]|nr:hypothetical protein [Planctomycetaceae bacterium]
MLSHLIRRVFGNLSSGRRIPSGVLADGWWRRVTRRRRRAGQRFAPSEALESRTLLTAYLVDSLSDYVVAGDNQLTLREALQAANSNMMVGDAVAGSDTDVDTITFADTLSGGTITLGGSQLTITDDVTITGLGADQLGVSGNNTNRVFQINADVTAEITGVTITGGYAPNGGGIFNAGTLTLNSVVVSENESTSSDGGGIYTRGELHLHNSTVKDNLSAFRGGGIFNDGTASTSDSTISGNTSGNFGGGIYSYARHGGSLTVLRSTIHDNFAPDIGGGIRVFDGVATVMQSTISGNSASQGGGIAVAMGSVTVKQSTLANNSAETGGGISVRDSSGSLNASQTIISGNVADSEGDEIYVDNGTVTLDSFNLIGDAEKSTGDALFVNAGTLITGPSDILATSDSANPFPLDKIVGPLADNGGPTLTHTLVAGSPAINAGDKSDGNASSPG